MNLNSYQKTAIVTVAATIFLIFVGGLVRAAGAGLGCPDWPRCFGTWIPPVSAAELPPGFDTSQFNLFKTWTEYINRLIGVVIGLLISATFALSFRYRKKTPAVFYSSGAAFFLVLVQGWLGGRVVMTGLDEWLITIHMVLAMAIMTILLYAAFKATSDRVSIDITPKIKKRLFWSGFFLLFFTLVQLVIGTQVREAVDIIKNAAVVPPRDTWLQMTGPVDEIHRSFSWIIVICAGTVLYFSKWKTESDLLEKMGLGLAALVVFQVLLGVGLYYLGMPPAYQVFHLVGVAFLICLEVLLLLVLKLPPPDAGTS